MVQPLGGLLIIIGIIGSIFCYFTNSYEQFQGVWGKCVGAGVVLMFIGGVSGL